VEYFAHARTALKYGLGCLGLGPGDKILVPNYVCEALIQPMRDLAIKPIFYPVDDSLHPRWEVLETISRRIACRAIVMIHYFGQPQDIRRFQKFCLKRRLYLIEDNAHGFGGMFNGKLLGTYGDLGISSPRKILGTRYGGILYLGGKVRITHDLKQKGSNVLELVLRRGFVNYPSSKILALKIANRLPNLEDPFFFREPPVKAALADISSSRTIIEVLAERQLERLASRRRANWKRWSDLAGENGWRPIYSKVHEESSPWMFPVYVDSPRARENLVSRGLKKGFLFAPWPALPSEILGSDQVALRRWGRLVCLPLDREPPHKTLFSL
jgi:perosamine synthetase